MNDPRKKRDRFAKFVWEAVYKYIGGFIQNLMLYETNKYSPGHQRHLGEASKTNYKSPSFDEVSTALMPIQISSQSRDQAVCLSVGKTVALPLHKSPDVTWDIPRQILRSCDSTIETVISNLLPDENLGAGPSRHGDSCSGGAHRTRFLSFTIGGDVDANRYCACRKSTTGTFYIWNFNGGIVRFF